MTIPQRRTKSSRVFAAVLVLVLGAHFLFTFTWNSAPNALRSAIGQDALMGYMTPAFTQGWAVFAPNPGAANVSLEVRALLPGADGMPSESEWFSITEHDNAAAILHNPLPSRLYLGSYILGDRFHSSFLGMDASVRELVGGDFRGDGWLERIEEALLGGAAAGSNPAVTTYIEYEQTVTGMATAVARARWGDEITAVQVKVVTTPVVPFAQRHDPAAVAEPGYFIEGWREPLDVAGLDQGVFDAMYGMDDNS